MATTRFPDAVPWRDEADLVLLTKIDLVVDEAAVRDWIAIVTDAPLVASHQSHLPVVRHE